MSTDAKSQPDRLSKEIDRLSLALDTHQPASKEYAAILEQLIKLHRLKDDANKQPPAAPRVSHDTLAMIAANLIGIVLVVGYEHTGIISSKAFGMITKPR